ncbi:hypothetical protein L0F51_03975 [Afifella sp. H1R]|uniref:hypothetical protein n=1 Tax=Afifella sp. H1R TaxID=2908841 RepID=UPI001F29CEB3|nr:hypothetical protein [Afifella sp. H1R]MCF1502924.1 hypothetical protein [Afifella sp. H1R]
MSEMELRKLLDERKAKHGDFSDHARITRDLKRIVAGELTLRSVRCQGGITPVMEEAIDMIQHKIGRILAGDPSEADHWDDIAGYATLVADRVRGRKQEPSANERSVPRADAVPSCGPLTAEEMAAERVKARQPAAGYDPTVIAKLSSNAEKLTILPEDTSQASITIPLGQPITPELMEEIWKFNSSTASDEWQPVPADGLFFSLGEIGVRKPSEPAEPGPKKRRGKRVRRLAKRLLWQISKFEEGCSHTFVEVGGSGRPEDCPECVRGLIDAMTRELIKAKGDRP